MFGIFILACGTTHVMAAITLWHPLYRLEGWVKAITALASIVTAIVLFPIIPKALRLRSPDDLEDLNRQLELKNSEIESSRASFRNIVERNEEGILVVAEDRKVVFANQAAFGFLKCGPSALIGSDFKHALEPGTVSALPNGDVEDGERTDTEIWVSETQWEGRPARLVNLRDITGRKQAEDALRSSREQLVQSQKMEAIGRLAGGIAHDFNNLLTAINGFNSLALARLPESEPIREHLVEVAKAGDRASELTRQLLAFSRKQILAPQNVDLNKVVAEIGNMIRRIIGEDIVLTTRAEEGLPDIRMDRGQLEQIVMNLAVNARDAMPQGGDLQLQTAKVEFAGRMIGGDEEMSPGEYVMLAVSDTGVGMTEETKSRLFEPFFTTKEPGKGTGLGLSMVYGIVKQSEGHIMVFSEPGKGTAFKLYFPLASASHAVPVSASSPASGVPAGKEGAARNGTETILVVEDEYPVRKLVVDVLKSAGYAVLDADSGEAALETAARHQGPLHLLLTDVIMRKMGGTRLADRLQKEKPSLKVLFMSGYTGDAILQHGMPNPSTDFIQKPFSPSRLLVKVREILDATAPSRGA
jgi:signal transduction histidine kinase/CheY-like chemotaxis protein